MNESVDLVIMNPTQFVWVQTNVRKERYHILFKMTNMQKKGCWLYNPYSPYGCWRGMFVWHVEKLNWQDRTTHGIHWLTDVDEWYCDMWQETIGTVGMWHGLFAVNEMVTRGPINGRHVSHVYWFKIYGSLWESNLGPPHQSKPLQSPCCQHTTLYFLLYIWFCIY